MSTGWEIVEKLPEKAAMGYLTDRLMRSKDPRAKLVAEVASMTTGEASLQVSALAKARDLQVAEMAAELNARRKLKPDAWARVDLSEVSDEPVVPTLWRRTDGAFMLYEGRTHSIVGESGSGKSWTAQGISVEVLESGRSVLYLDFEGSARGVRHRLRLLGAQAEDFTRFAYVNPQGPPEGEAFEALLAEPWGLVVIDGVTAALGVSGLVGSSLSMDNDATTRWHNMLPERFAKAGAAVVMVDHVTKSSDGRGGYAIGAQAKRAALSGALFIVEKRKAFAVGKDGLLVVKVSKDREGAVEGRSEGEELPLEAGRIQAHSGEGSVRLIFQPPVPAPTEEEKADDLKLAICRAIAKEPGISKGAVETEVEGRASTIRKALAELVEQGVVLAKREGRTKRNTLAVPLEQIEASLDFATPVPPAEAGTRSGRDR